MSDSSAALAALDEYPFLTSNIRAKIYPGGTQLQISNHALFSVPGRILSMEPRQKLHSDDSTDKAHSLQVSRTRARSKVRDIALCNRFTHFLTLTFDPEKIDRYSPEDVKRALETFFRNKGSRNGFRYVAVPELHADGAIHIHALCCPGSCELRRAVNPKTGKPLTKGGRPVFNLTDWKWGFSTCVPLDENYERAVNYVVKYIDKASEKIFGKWYFSSRFLTKTPEIQLLEPQSFPQFCEKHPDAKPFPIFNDVVMASVWYARPQGEAMPD